MDRGTFRFFHLTDRPTTAKFLFTIVDVVKSATEVVGGNFPQLPQAGFMVLCEPSFLKAWSIGDPIANSNVQPWSQSYAFKFQHQERW
jgi:hypothetical protein